MIRQNSPTAWLLAARPKTLTGALVPVMIATALACHDGQFRWITALLCALFACGMQIAANFVNDWYDFKKGTDRADRLGPERACAQGWITLDAMKKGIVVAMALSCCAGLVAMFLEMDSLRYHGWELVAIGALCVLFCILYTTTLSYAGWGDVLVLVFFGFVPVCGTYYLLMHTVSSLSVWLGMASGLTIETLLIVNNYRDRDQDTVSGKRTLIVRWGKRFGEMMYLSVGLVAAWLPLLVAGDGHNQIALIAACVIYMMAHISTCRKMVKIGKGKELNSILGENSRNMLLYGVLLSLAIAL